MNLINVGIVKPKVSTFMSYNITRIMESAESKEYNFLTLEYVHTYCKTSNISRTLADNKIVDNSDVVGAAAALLQLHLHSQTTAQGYKKHLNFGIWCDLY